MATEKEEEKPECGICFEPITIIGKLNTCAHTFCYDCIEQWSKVQNTCPHCKKRFNKIEKVDLNEPENPTGKGRKRKRGTIKTVRRTDPKSDWNPSRSELLQIMMNGLPSIFPQGPFRMQLPMYRPPAYLRNDDDYDSDEDSDYEEPPQYTVGDRIIPVIFHTLPSQRRRRQPTGPVEVIDLTEGENDDDVIISAVNPHSVSSSSSSRAILPSAPSSSSSSSVTSVNVSLPSSSSSNALVVQEENDEAGGLLPLDDAQNDRKRRRIEAH